MQIDVAVTRQIEHPWRNDAAIGNDQDGIRPDALKVSAEFRVVLDLLRLRNWQASRQCCPLDGRRLQLKSAAYCAVRLRDDQRDLMASREDCFECRDCKLRRSAEDELHRFILGAYGGRRGYHSPFFCILRILRNASSRFRRLMRSIKRTPFR